MKSRLIFALSVALIFLTTSILTYSQDKPTNTSEKSAKQTQVKQVTPTINKKVEKKTTIAANKKVEKKTTLAANKKVEKSKQMKKGEKTSKVKEQKVVKNKTSKTAHNKVMMHHKKMDKKTANKESKTPEKK